MLYLLFGEDIDLARKKANALVETLRAKKPDAGVFFMDDESWSAARFEELLSGQGLFERKNIVLLRRVLANKEVMENILEKLPEIKKSENIFIILEGKLTKEISAELKKFSEKSQEFEKVAKSETKNDFKIFALADTFSRRDKKNLWVLYRKAIRQGALPEELSGILFWKIKDMILAGERRGTGRFSREELLRFAFRIVSLYHDSHRGLIDFEVGLESFLLSL